jgi:hypothetical protein
LLPKEAKKKKEEKKDEDLVWWWWWWWCASSLAVTLSFSSCEIQNWIFRRVLLLWS